MVILDSFFRNNLGLGAYFSKPIFLLKPWDWASQFECHEPFNRNDFCFTYKGVREILMQPPPKLKNLKIKKNHVFSVSIYHAAIKYE